MVYLTGQRLSVGCRVRGAKTEADGTELRAGRPAVGHCVDEVGAAAQPSGSKLSRHKGNESLALNFHQRRVAMSVSDISCLCTKITFSAFEDSPSK
ncbi:hypothetical protein [Pseudomonas sp. G2-4]|uniref:hypothetical protein n=1 Tax=Pseudomonas sp. G2-4 TaxID=1506334 RepID=UPI0024B9A78F|nr:hypothetical protein [Pseudomonas sp. G2-4]WHS61079.1 hypothetical protein QNH97_03285 [Pseudomonas sp. G2-4]